MVQPPGNQVTRTNRANARYWILICPNFNLHRKNKFISVYIVCKPERLTAMHNETANWWIPNSMSFMFTTLTSLQCHKSNPGSLSSPQIQGTIKIRWWLILTDADKNYSPCFSVRYQSAFFIIRLCRRFLQRRTCNSWSNESKYLQQKTYLWKDGITILPLHLSFNFTNATY